MLVLSRKAGEALSLGHDITVEVIAVEGDRVRIGIQAPAEIRIFRKELLVETIDINQSAAKTALVSLPEPKSKKE